MERIVEVDGKNLVLGLEWSKLAGEKPAEAAKRLANTRKCPMGVLWSVMVQEDDGSSNQVVHSVGLSHTKLKGVAYSGAAALASAQSSVIGIEQIGDDLYWMAVTENGRVLPGYDALASESEVKRKLQELAIDTQLDYMVFYMESAVADRFGIDGAYNESPLNLIKSAGVNDTMRVRKMSAIPRAVFLGLGIIMIGGGLFAYMEHQKAEKQRELEELMALEAQSLEQIEQEVTVEKVINKGPTDADLLRHARQEEIIWLRDDFNKVNRVPALKSVLLTASSVPFQAGGWTLKEIVFSSEAEDRVNVIWNRDYGSPNSLKDFMKGRASTGFTPDFTMGNSSFKVKLGSQGFQDILSVVKDSGVKHQDFASRLIEMGITFEASMTEAKPRKETISGLKDKTLENMAQLEVTSRDFTLTGDNIDSYVIAMKALESADNFLLERITVTNQGNKELAWKVAGKLYE